MSHPAPPDTAHADTEPKRSPLQDRHVALGAAFTDFGGWQMPVRYASDLAEHHAVVIVPGVASPMAAAARALRPLSARNDILTVIPGPLDDEALAERLLHAEAFVIMKLGRHFDRVRSLIERLGLLDRAVYCERVTLAEERVLPLATVSGAAPYFSMILGYRGEEPAIASRYARDPARMPSTPSSNVTDQA